MFHRRATTAAKKSARVKKRAGGISFNTKGKPWGTGDRRFGVKELREQRMVAAYHKAGIKI